MLKPDVFYLQACERRQVSSEEHLHVVIYVAQIVNSMLGRMCLLRDFHFTLLYCYITVR